MKTRLFNYWERIRASFWFLPAAMSIVAVALGLGIVAVDNAVPREWIDALGWVYTGGAEGASAVLQTIAGSMITIAGVVFSLTLIALSLASSQFGPRLLRNFMRDTANQLVLGTFVATFIYCLLILRTIRRGDETSFVPHLAVTLGIILAIASIWVLIYFIHHVSVSIQAEEVIARVSAELESSIDRMYPRPHAAEHSEQSEIVPAPNRAAIAEESGVEVHAIRDGYLQFVDIGRLVDLAADLDGVIRVERRPGDYVIEGMSLVTIRCTHELDDDAQRRIAGAFSVGNRRSAVQDVEFTVHQLVEIAVRALSPGINDPFTAISCIDRLGSGLARLSRRELPQSWRSDDDGSLRVLFPVVSFADVADASFDQVRQAARTSAAVTGRLIEMIAAVATVAMRSDDRDALRRHAELVERSASEGLAEAEDRARVAQVSAEVVELLGSSRA